MLLNIIRYLNLKVIISVNILITEPPKLIEEDNVNPSLDDEEVIRVNDFEASSQGGFSLGNESMIIRRVESFHSVHNALSEKSGGGAQHILGRERIESPAKDRDNGENEQHF